MSPAYVYFLLQRLAKLSALEDFVYVFIASVMTSHAIELHFLRWKKRTFYGKMCLKNPGKRESNAYSLIHISVYIE